MGEADKVSRTLGSGTDVTYEIAKNGKLRIIVEVDEDKIARTVLPKLVALLGGKAEEKPAPKKRGPRKAKPGQPGYVSDATAPIPFPDPARAGIVEVPIPVGAKR